MTNQNDDAIRLRSPTASPLRSLQESSECYFLLQKIEMLFPVKLAFYTILYWDAANWLQSLAC